MEFGPGITQLAKSVNPQPGDVYVNPLLPNICNAFFQVTGGLHKLFAAYPSDLQSGYFAKVDRGDTLRSATQLKSPKGGIAQTGMGVTVNSQFFCDVYELEFPMTEQLAANWRLPLVRDQAAARHLARSAYLRRELNFTEAFMKTGVWGTDYNVSSSSTVWSDPTSDPISDIENGIEAILKATGMRPNVMAMAYDVWKALKQHPLILARITAVTNVKDIRQATRMQIAQLFELEEVMVGEVTYNTANSGATASMSFTVAGKALLAYRSPAPSPIDPTAGSMFTWQGLTGSVEGTRIRNGQDLRTGEYWYQIQHAEDFKLVDSVLGYYFYNCV